MYIQSEKIPLNEIAKLVIYLHRAEERDFDARGRPDHIYRSVERVAEWLHGICTNRSAS
jgi:hypothetical protein